MTCVFKVGDIVRSTYETFGTPLRYTGTIIQITYDSKWKPYANITNGIEAYTDFLSDLEHVDMFVKLERMLEARGL